MTRPPVLFVHGYSSGPGAFDAWRRVRVIDERCEAVPDYGLDLDSFRLPTGTTLVELTIDRELVVDTVVRLVGR